MSSSKAFNPYSITIGDITFVSRERYNVNSCERCNGNNYCSCDSYSNDIFGIESNYEPPEEEYL